MNITREFNHGIDRYLFDFKLCTYAKGWAQIDTDQDASYFGTWTNPWERKIVNYCEGDITTQTADNDGDYREALVECLTFRQPYAKIDANKLQSDRFIELGLASYLH